MPETPIASRPRMFGSTVQSLDALPWTWAVETLTAAQHYWIATTRPDGRPHSRPVWGVIVDEAVLFSTGSLADGNLRADPEISVHTESATNVVIVEGRAELEPDRAVVERACAAYEVKYREAMDPDALPGPFWVVRPRLVFGWMSCPTYLDGGAVFHATATRWSFVQKPVPTTGL
jgi:Pyridoxamine 5'-phosphate oxidase